MVEVGDSCLYFFRRETDMTQSTLKLLAMLFMLCDHFAKVVLSTGVLLPAVGVAGNQYLMIALETIGRMAFPIFAWFVAEGCRKTKNYPRYLTRLAMFAVLSEAPFQYCFYQAGQNGLTFACHNVIFTMLLSAAGIYGARKIKAYGVPDVVAMLFPSVAVVALGWVLKTDYNAWGVALILMLYYLPEKKQKLALLGCWMTVFMLFWHGWNGETFVWLHPGGTGLIWMWLGGMVSVPVLATYNGVRGRKMKWLFYIFYPVHLTVLYAISCRI